MVSLNEAKKSALALPEVEEKSHFDKPDFRVKNKIFAVIHKDKTCMMVKLSPIDQSVFCAFDETIVYPVPGGWGRKRGYYDQLEKSQESHVPGCFNCCMENSGTTKTGD
jgi:hypothetical protein